MRFTLIYEGELLSRGDAAHKGAIREALHPQLRELWTHEPLNNYPEYLRPNTEPGSICVLEDVGRHVYAPLITSRLELLADVEILLLRPERPGGIVTSGGDIDNRLKTLFDALSVPRQEHGIAANAAPSSIDAPTYTLLEDDSLIARIAVDTDRLLAAPTPSYVRMSIRVSLRARKIIFGNQLLIS